MTAFHQPQLIDYEEFRILLAPEIAPSGQLTGNYDVVLDKCPVPGLKGRKGSTRSQLKKELLLKLRNPTFTSSEPLLREVGDAVWQTVMTPRMEAAFEACEAFVSAKHWGLRIVISAYRPEGQAVDGEMAGIADLPFELLRRPGGAALTPFVATDPASPISRDLRDVASVPTYGVTGPLRILVIVANPSDFPEIRATEETAAIKAALKAAIESRQIELEFCEPPTLAELSKRLSQGPWHVLHFAGHGGIDNDSGLRQAYLAFVRADPANPRPESEKVYAERLGITLLPVTDLKLVVLSACAGAQGSGPQAASAWRSFDSIAAYLLTNRNLAAVVAMQFDFETAAAATFSKTFYEGLASQDPIDAIVTEVRRAIINSGNPFDVGHRAWVAPTLLSRSENGKIFERTCDLNGEAQAQIHNRKIALDSSRPLVDEFLKAMRGVTATPGLLQFKESQKGQIAATMKGIAEWLGDAIRLEPASAKPGETALCRLFLRPRQNAVFQSFTLKVRIPDALRYNVWHPGAGLPPTATITTGVAGQDLQIVYVDTAPGPQPWPGRQERELGQIELNVRDGQPAGIVDLWFPELPRIQPAAAKCFTCVDSLIFVE